MFQDVATADNVGLVAGVTRRIVVRNETDPVIEIFTNGGLRGAWIKSVTTVPSELTD
jgi:hypothetical protein